ncbi:hypothetical protein AQUCO_02000283v1 [Aquilegia coerulea]|uniref:Uncharacterized protein n=1 Tax=Aquilegia coerulea TaxID=218851 RepID=A0A2G5DGT5_AQUCA|nr:hypothetical protein AQUCO_02000283v1 [Aquilegia coerulea]
MLRKRSSGKGGRYLSFKSCNTDGMISSRERSLDSLWGQVVCLCFVLWGHGCAIAHPECSIKSVNYSRI